MSSMVDNNSMQDKCSSNSFQNVDWGIKHTGDDRGGQRVLLAWRLAQQLVPVDCASGAAITSNWACNGWCSRTVQNHARAHSCPGGARIPSSA